MTLSARGLGCDFGPVRAVDDVDLDTHGGSMLAVFGPNGAGKSTLLAALSGERRPDRGAVTMDGKPVAGSDPAWRSRVGLVSHRTGLYARLTAAENLAFFAAMHGARSSRAAVVGALAGVEAERLADVPARELSRGQRQRVAVARTLLHGPDVLFLDEPFAGLDPAGAALLVGVLARRRKEGAIVVLVTHNLARGLELADRLIVLRRGRKVLDRPTAGARPETLLRFFAAPDGGRTRPGSPAGTPDAAPRATAGQTRNSAARA